MAQYFTQLNSYHVVLEVPPALQATRRCSSKLYITSPLTGKQVPLSTVRQGRHHARPPSLTISHQSQFPAVTLSFNLAPGVALGQAWTRSSKAQARDGRCRRR